MTLGLVLAFLFFVGACAGWALEFLYRNLVSHKGPRGQYFINPGFCTGPWLPIYGIGLSAMCLISYIVQEYIPGASPVLVIICIAIVMNLIEFTGGMILLKFFNMRLWDYRDRPGNYKGIVCPMFALIWTAISAGYYLFIHDHAISWIMWLSQHLAFSFFVGLFWGLFLIDFVNTQNRAQIIKEFGRDNDLIVKWDELTHRIYQEHYAIQAKKFKLFDELTENAVNLRKELEDIFGEETN